MAPPLPPRRRPLLLLAAAAVLLPLLAAAAPAVFFARMVHRLSDEARAVAAGGGGAWPRRGSAEYYRILARSDLQRQKRRVGSRYQTLFPSEGSEIFSLGNDFGWLYYTWVDIGTPNTSFLVALDSGSDLFWVPCDCIQCAPLSGYHGTLDRDLVIYNPAKSTTSRHLPCSHELCSSGSSCSNPKQPCLYSINYYSENTTSAGLLIEDTLHLALREGHTPTQVSVVIGCGRKQSGGYLDGIAPDGLLGLGLADISVPSFLSRAGLVRNSFSMCFKEDDSGRILFGDQGVSTQLSTPFIPLNGKLVTYAVDVEKFCIGHKCLEGTNFQALVDSGSSFTSLPHDAYKRVSVEFDGQVNASRINYEDSPWEYCYSASLEMPEVPTLTLTFAVNKNFLAVNPVYPLYDKEEALAGFCLAVQPSAETVGIIGQNFLVGYHVVFDRENLKLGWYRSECHDIDNSTTVPLAPSQHNRPENPLPTNEQQTSPAVTPAVAGRAPAISNGSRTSRKVFANFYLLLLLTKFTVLFIG